MRRAALLRGSYPFASFPPPAGPRRREPRGRGRHPDGISGTGFAHNRRGAARAAYLLGRFERARDGKRNPLPLLRFGFELAAPWPGEPIKLGLPVVLRFAPCGGEPSGLLHAMQSGK